MSSISVSAPTGRSLWSAVGNAIAWLSAWLWFFLARLWRAYMWLSFGPALSAQAGWRARCKYYIRGCLCATFIGGTVVSGLVIVPYVNAVVTNWNRLHSCLRKVIYYEAAKEPQLGQIAVGFSVEGRAEMGARGKGGYPSDPCEVTTQVGAPTKRWVTTGKGADQKTHMVWDCPYQYKGICYAAEKDPQGPLWEKAGENATIAMLVYYFLPESMRRYTFFATQPPGWWEKKLKLDCNFRIGAHTFCSQPEPELKEPTHVAKKAPVPAPARKPPPPSASVRVAQK